MRIFYRLLDIWILPYMFSVVLCKCARAFISPPQNKTEPLPVGEWFYELIWCPSQCYYHLQVNGTDYILYLRWRWENPWQAHVVQNSASLDEMNKDRAIWSKDVFALHHT